MRIENLPEFNTILASCSVRLEIEKLLEILNKIFKINELILRKFSILLAKEIIRQNH